jgi:hypothetical protein
LTDDHPSLLDWRELILDADMQLLLSAAKPHATPRAQLLWLVDLLKAEESPVESAALRPHTSWSCHLHVIAGMAQACAPVMSNDRSPIITARAVRSVASAPRIVVALSSW